MDVEELKKKELENEELKQATLRVYQAFRDGFFKHLHEFADKAVEVGLNAVVPCREANLGGGILQLDFVLNGAELLLIAPSDIFWLRNADGDRLAGKMFLYRDRKNNVRPSIEVAVERLLNGQYVCEMRCFSDSKPGVLFREWMSEEMGGEVGARAADRLIEHFYSLKDSWLDQPTLGAFLERRDGPRRMGFTTSS